MSQQGEKPTGHEDDWWGQLYDDSTEDTGPAAVADSLDDRFASAAGTMGLGQPDVPPPPERPPAAPDSSPGRPEQPPAVPEQRGGLTRRLAPWEPPRDGPPAPATFPPGPTPPGFRTQEPRSGPPQEPLSRTSPQSPAAAVPASRAPFDAPPAPMSPPAVAPGGDTLPITPSDARPPRPASAPQDTPPSAPEAAPPRRPTLSVAHQPPAVDHVGSGPPTYDAEPTALPPADPDDLDDLVADTVLDGARYGTSTLRAVSVRGDSARYRGEPRRDSLLTARFGTGEQALVLVAMATGARATPGAHRAAAEACQWIGRAVGRSHARLAEDIRAARRGDLKSGLHRLTDRSLGKLRATAAEQGIEPEEYTASLRCLLLPADPACRTRVFFGVGTGGLFRLRDGEWQDIEPRAAEATGEAVVGFGSPPHETPEGDRLTMDLGITTPPSPYEPAPEPPRDPFRFRASVARPGDTLLLCTGGLADPLRGEPELAGHLTTRWSAGEPPGLAAFLADTLVRVKGYADDRTAAAVWEA
ncbi:MULTISPECIES: protein phosphatase 2C domain-containing protein [unclassified Streptomyces]|uniref:PP2C family serine/threonine-protein phosphatase n=1 Tax=unclassified Streptomyces TaxID=2593676 RepID=UPI002E81DE30|nr:protein phosphatase 2C domain-containing protein [Streptomyces sp. NBC_00589]WTI35308.1 protein phosphatase 2C domain-containing protein [Streptomyces sp. NBC_00775]WUB31018.1 protein phosphatase 2C domain-containing protein [Streptomyces sp. NBC_00589]